MMSEFQPNFPDMSERDLLELMSPDQLVDHIMSQGEEVTKIEKNMNLAGEVLEGYGVTFESILRERKKQNEQ